MDVSFRFSDEWSDRYQRNNKHGGLKNLRCFPYCSKDHKKTGFCGNAARVRTRRLGQAPLDELYAWAEFHPVNEPPMMAPGSVVPQSSLECSEKSKDSPKNPLLPGEVYLEEVDKFRGTEDDEKAGFWTNAKKFPEFEEEGSAALRRKPAVYFAFNRRKKGWTYTWLASKHRAATMHALFVYFMVPHDALGNMRCVHIHRSPSFVVFSRKIPDSVEICPTPAQPVYSSEAPLLNVASSPSSFESSQRIGKETAALSKAQPAKESLDLSSDFADFIKLDSIADASEMPTETDEFRRFFIDSFWDDENADIKGFSPGRKRNRESSEDISMPLVESFPCEREEPKNDLEDLPTTLPQPPPLRPMKSKDIAHRVDSPPPSEVRPYLGHCVDFEEDYLNTKLWRLVLVLALAEAHWSAIGIIESPSSPSKDDNIFNKILRNDALADDVPLPKSAPEANEDTQVTKHERHFEELRCSSSSETPEESIKFLPNMSQDSRAIVRELAIFLVEERSFTKAIEETMTSLPSDASNKEIKSAFVKVAHEQLAEFFGKFGLTVAQFDSLFEDKPSLTFLKQAAKRLQMLNETMASYTDQKKEKLSTRATSWMESSLKRERRAAVPRMVCVNCSGEYEMDDDLLNAHDHFRGLRGVPWTLRKMIGFIEKNFIIEQTAYEKIYMQGQRKLLSNGGNLYITDGRLRRFTLLSPVPWSKPLAEYYKAWFGPPYLHVIHYYSETARLSRVIHYQTYRLHFRLSFERLDLLTKEWQVVECREGYANLVRMLPNFNADKHSPLF